MKECFPAFFIERYCYTDMEDSPCLYIYVCIYSFIYVFIYGLFNDSISVSYSIALHARIINNELGRVWKELVLG
jgi:hypothetical protein